MYDPFANFKTAVLSNGCTVHVLHMQERESVEVRMIIHSGANEDPLGLEGLAHFVEHMVSANMPLPLQEMKERIAELGAIPNFGATSGYATRYKFNASTNPQTLEELFGLYGQMLMRAHFTKNLERERSVIIGEFHRSFPTPFTHKLLMDMRKILFNDSWAARMARPFGTLDAITCITLSDLQQFANKHYTPANTSIVCVGGVSLQQVVALLERTDFAIDKPGVRTKLPEVSMHITPPSVREEYIAMSCYVPDYTQATCRITTRIPLGYNIHAVEYLCKLLHKIIKEEIREKHGFSYNPQAYITNWGNCTFLELLSGNVSPNVVEDAKTHMVHCISQVPELKSEFLRMQHSDNLRDDLYDPNMEAIADSALEDLVDYQRIIPREDWIRDRQKTTFQEILGLMSHFSEDVRYTCIVRP